MKKIIRKFLSISLFDTIIIILVLCGIILFAFIFFRKATYLTVTIKVGSNNILWTGGSSHEWFSHYFRTGMTQKDGFGKINAEVLSVRSFDMGDSRTSVYLTTKLKTVYNRATNQYTYLGKPILIGSPIKLYLDQILVEGLVTRMDGVKDLRIKKFITVETQLLEESPVYPETSGVRPYIADAIQEGQTVSDSRGNIVVKILKKTVEDAKKTVTTSDGRVVIQQNPLRKDVYLTLQIEAVQQGGRFYVYDDVPLLIGYEIPINTQTYAISPEITKFISAL